MGKLFLLLSAVSGFLGVSIGAFGAHGLESVLDPELMGTYQTGVEYQLFHTAALLGIGILSLQYPKAKALQLSGLMMVVGIVVFSGSLYLLALSGVSWLGAITPIGGVAFLAAWAALFRFAWKLTSEAKI